jgi:class 3 adenylate cyclase
MRLPVERERQLGKGILTASRLESVTKELGWPVVFSAVAREHLPEAQRAALSPLGEIKLKGRADAVDVWGLST